ncbi:hypothetical protein [Shewanella gelidii]|uniref:hypothetical protein n=1 Tax=Shewanella gelidii TaxID=1642821 RepID=UPI0016648E4B|nr:hypothetical protein [Shewanella gelidii]MCL1097010.1 hypothetical protein [Shewanella gelidii]
MATYQIIDEPKTRALDRLIVDPTIILFVGIFLPFIWNPPFLGRFWIPLVWLLVNGFLLGSPTIKKELVFAILGSICWFFIPVLVDSIVQLSGWNIPTENVRPYSQIVGMGVFFFTLYMVVFLQSAPFAIFQYLKNQANR